MTITDREYENVKELLVENHLKSIESILKLQKRLLG